MTQRTNRTEKLDLRLSRAAKKTLQPAAAPRRERSSRSANSCSTPRSARLRSGWPTGVSSRSTPRDGTLSWPRSMRRRAVTRALSGCSVSFPCSIPKANRDAFASYRKIASDTQRRAIHLRAAGSRSLPDTLPQAQQSNSVADLGCRSRRR